MKAAKEVRYRRFYIACSGKQFVIKTWCGEALKTAESLAAAKAEVDRILQGSNRTDASAYGCPV